MKLIYGSQNTIRPGKRIYYNDCLYTEEEFIKQNKDDLIVFEITSKNYREEISYAEHVLESKINNSNDLFTHILYENYLHDLFELKYFFE